MFQANLKTPSNAPPNTQHTIQIKVTIGVTVVTTAQAIVVITK
jgi:hypothetical protein